jgi:hypothetical protein
VHKKAKGLFPCLWERPFDAAGASPVAGRGGLSALHRCQTSSLPKANKPCSDKEEGRNKAEKELAVVDHCLIDVVNANVKVNLRSA